MSKEDIARLAVILAEPGFALLAACPEARAYYIARRLAR